MSTIINTNTSTLPVLTTEQKQKNLQTRVNYRINALFRSMEKEYNAIMPLIWANPDGLTQAESLSAFGVSAVELFRLGAILSTAINDAIPGTITQTSSPVPVTPHEDGTVTINA